VTVAVQRDQELDQEFPADGTPITWRLEARVVGTDLRGPYVHGRPGDRFLYLSWQQEGPGRFRRAKLMLDAVTPELLARAQEHGLAARVSLAMPDGSPLCAAVRPPRIEWSGLEG